MTPPLIDTQDEQLREAVKRFCRTDEATDNLVAFIKVEIRKAEERGYVIGFNACVDDCPDKMSTEPYGAEEVK